MSDRLYADPKFYARVQKIKLGLIAVLLLLAWAAGAFGQERRELRVDTFDTHGNRTGYTVVNPQTGRVETFDSKSRRTGSGQITPAPGAGAPSCPGCPAPPRSTSSPTPWPGVNPLKRNDERRPTR